MLSCIGRLLSEKVDVWRLTFYTAPVTVGYSNLIDTPSGTSRTGAQHPLSGLVLALLEAGGELDQAIASGCSARSA
jgi:hypothetical protein